MKISTSEAYARELDASDPLAHLRDRYKITDPDLIYLDGNSLGRMPVAAADLARDLLEWQWSDCLIRSWNEGWIHLPERLGAKIARLLGARPDEVIVADSTSVNLFKLIVAGLRLRAGRARILTDDLNFPSDLYIAEGAIDLLGGRHRLELIPSSDGVHGPLDGILAALDDDVALVMLSHTAFKSGYTYDLAKVTRAAHAAGALMLWDLSHSAGALHVDLEAAGADLAVGCSYKYLCGGPGAPAFLYVRRDLQEALSNPISGWMGRRNLFDFGVHYHPEAGLRRFLTGTPPVVSTALIEPGVDILLEAGMDALRVKSWAQTGYLIDLWEEMLKPLGYTLNSPRDPAFRGSHVSIGHPEGLLIDLALIRDLSVLPDFRYPDNIRIGVAPAYTSFMDIHTAVLRMRRAVEEGMYTKYAAESPTVT
jgi:kynureninase